MSRDYPESDVKMPKALILTLSHILFAMAGFTLGVYTLPILMAPTAPSSAEVAGLQTRANFSGEFRRELTDSDFLHWGEGQVSIGESEITLVGSIAPGPDYRLYLSPEFVETEAAFNQLKSEMVQVGPVKTFDNFVVPVPDGINPGAYTSVVIWCEAFGQFITAARYR
jgi:Electron transfer DM13